MVTVTAQVPPRGAVRRPGGTRVAPWRALCRWASTRDLTRIDLSVQAGVHLLFGIGLLFLPPALRRSHTLAVLLDGGVIGVEFRVLWAAAFLAAGTALAVACRWPDAWGLQHAAWGLSIPLVAMWLAGLLLVLPSAEGNALALVPFVGMFFWHLTTAVRLWARST